MKRRLAVIALLILALSFSFAFGSGAEAAQSRAHVYLFRGLADIFSTGMDTLTDELNRRGVYATSHSHTDWKPLADQAAADYKAGKEGPIILIGHSLGADAVMEMADYLGDKGVPVALVIPFDGTQSFPASANISRVVNFTQRDYAYMRKGPGFRGTLVNVDVSSDPDIGHLNIDKSPRLHARAISEVLAVAAGHMGPPVAEKPAGAPLPGAAASGGSAHHDGAGRSEEPRGVERETPAAANPAKPSPEKTDEALKGEAATKPETSPPSPVIVQPQAPAAPVSPALPAQSLPAQPPRPVPVAPLQIPD
jgi:Thioesterase domain